MRSSPTTSRPRSTSSRLVYSSKWRLVNISSEQAPGFFSNHGPPDGAVCHPQYCPVDEAHPLAPSNPYALAKHFGEQLCDAAVRRTSGTIQIISIRPSWCQDERNIERNLR